MDVELRQQRFIHSTPELPTPSISSIAGKDLSIHVGVDAGFKIRA
jgi:hypothetical protein